MWDKPFELEKADYATVFNCLRKEHFSTDADDDGIFTRRKSTGEYIFLHFYPHEDYINYNYDNEEHTFYQTGPLLEEEQKREDEMTAPRVIVLENQEEVQNFLNEVLALQKEYYGETEQK